jgi:hypothetical protein
MCGSLLPHCFENFIIIIIINNIISVMFITDLSIRLTNPSMTDLLCTNYDLSAILVETGENHEASKIYNC